LTVRLTAKDTGLVWVAVITDDDLATTAPPTMSAPQVKLGNGAMGRLTCRSSGSPVSAGVATTIVLHGCELLGGGNYALFAYVESTLGLDSDGSLFGPLQFQVPQPSNSFSVKAAINNNTLNKDGLDVSFATSAPAGMGYVMVAYEASYLQLSVTALASGMPLFITSATLFDCPVAGSLVVPPTASWCTWRMVVLGTTAVFPSLCC